MNAKTLWLCGLAGMVLCAAVLRGAEPGPYGMPGAAPQSGPNGQPAGPSLLAPNDIDHADATLSSWMLHPAGGDCCSPLDGKLIASEAYLRVGPSFNIGGRNLNGALDIGIDTSAGFRVSFFNHADDKAWVIDLGVSDIVNSTRSPGSYTLLNVFNRPSGPVYPQINVSPEGLNRTYFDYGIGREWYLWGPEHCDDVNVRVGADVGGRWGTAKMDFDQLNHRTGILEGVYTAVHADFIIPWRCYTLTTGVRFEWDYTWDHILQAQNNTDLSGFNLLLTGGILF
jgi:hypothetical protein